MILTIIYFVLILGITVFIHELGHFIFAKKAGVYVYEFSIGMGPVILHRHSKKDETNYCLRLFPIGGFVSMSGEDLEEDNADIPKDKQMCNKTWLQRCFIIVAGVLFNFLLAVLLLFIIGMISGVPNNKPVISELDSSYTISETNMQLGDVIKKINDKNVRTTDELSLELQIIKKGKGVTFTVEHLNGDIENIYVEPTLVNVDGTDTYKYGMMFDTTVKHGIIESIKYSFVKTGSLINQMCHIIKYLVTGKLSASNLAGPVGIFSIVDQTAKTGFVNVIFLIAYLCINVGFINIIPLPAFDGGRLLFLIIEKIKGSKVNPKIENTIHNIGFGLLMILMIFVTYNDILRLFK